MSKEQLERKLKEIENSVANNNRKLEEAAKEEQSLDAKIAALQAEKDKWHKKRQEAEKSTADMLPKKHDLENQLRQEAA